MEKLEGVILDWAGTAVDFGCFAPVNVFMEIFRQAGVPVTIAEARAPMGMLKWDHIKTMLEMPRISQAWQEQHGRSFSREDVDRLYAEFEPLLFATLAEYTQPLPQVIDTVAALRAQGIKIGSTTGYTDAMMAVVAQGAQDKGYAPDYWITPDSTQSYGRPYPYMIFRNMEKLGITAPWRALKVGDTASDIQEGIQAGVWTAGVIVGSSQLGFSQEEFERLPDMEREAVIERTRQAFLDAGADFTLRSLGELPGLLENIKGLLLQGQRPQGFKK